MSGEALQGLVDSINQRMRQIMELQQQNHEMTMNHHAQAHHNLLHRLTQPKQVIRDANGKIVGIK